MFSCEECGKQYGKQNSLTRHMENHRKSKQYICQLCKIAFFRRDLLLRHSKMHRSDEQHNSNASSSPHPVQGSTASSDRRRCHTACVRCRRLRTKCDGRHPCKTCINSGKDCEIGRGESRISQGILGGNAVTSISVSSADSVTREASEPQVAPAAVQAPNDEWYLDQGVGANHRSNDSYQHTDILPSPASLSDPASLMDVTDRQSYQPEPRTSNIYQPDNSLSPVLHPSTNDFDNMITNSEFDAMAWPWLHENLFLQSNRPALWPDTGLVNQPFSGQDDIDEAMDDETAGALLLMRTADRTPGELHGPAFSDMHTSCVAREWQSEPTEQGCGEIVHNTRPRQTDETPSSTPTRQRRLIELLVTDAAQVTSPVTKIDRTEYWFSMSTKVGDVFALSYLDLESSPHILQRFVDSYLQHFGPLWPLLSQQGLDCDILHPILYLTLASIGSMYGGVQATHFGTMIHNRIRQTLTTGLELGYVDDDIIWLAQARLLTQVSALYFGQSKAFSYAQHLGGVLVAQARRMRLFSAPRTPCSQDRGPESRQPEERLARWLRVEERRRLAFGILRAETYTSVLLNTRPLISSEEIDLELPSSDQTWRGPPLPVDIYLALVERDHKPGKARRFSDMIRVAFEREETASVIDPVSHELLLFGLQQAVWRFSHDHYLFQRLTGSDEAISTSSNNGLDSNTHTPEHLSGHEPPGRRKHLTEVGFLDIMEDHSSRPRGMCDLKSDLERLINALEKWKESFRFISSVPQSGRDRNTLLSSLLLYYLSYLRLQSPVEDIHHISYRVVEKRPVERNIIDDVYSWANSKRSYVAVQHALSIWSLISSEVHRPESTRAKFNFLGFVGLHHAAAVLWTYAGAHDPINDEAGSSVLTVASLNDSKPPIPLKSSNTPVILRQFSRVFDMIVPGSWSSLGVAALRLSECTFPALTET